MMRRPPRRLSDRVIDGEMWLGIVSVGLVMAAVTWWRSTSASTAASWADPATSTRPVPCLHQSWCCPALQLFNARSDRASAFHHPFTNRWLWAAIALSALLQVAVMQVPFLNDAFDTTPLSIEAWLTCLGLASGVLWADELKKFVQRRLRMGISP
jgi:Ca2+-transporting ATPase